MSSIDSLLRSIAAAAAYAVSPITSNRASCCRLAIRSRHGRTGDVLRTTAGPRHGCGRRQSAVIVSRILRTRRVFSITSNGRSYPMSLSMYQASIPAFLQMLDSLSAILEKAEAHALSRKIEPSVLLNTRLTPDMFPLVRQVQLTADFAKGGAGRIAGVELPKFPDTETSFAELKARIAKTIDFLKDFRPAQIDGSEGREITIPIGG